MSKLTGPRSRTLTADSLYVVPLLLLVLFLVLLAGCGQKQETDVPSTVVWTPYSEVQATFPRASRPLFLYVKQSGCSGCGMMDSLVFARPEIAKHLNRNYINVSINVDEDLPVTIGGKEYQYQEFFRLLHLDQIPSYFFFDTTGQVIGVLGAAVPLKTFKQFLVYVKGRNFYKTPWKEFEQSPEADLDTAWGVF